MTVTAQDMVRREVHYCVSSLVHTLAQGYGGALYAHNDLAQMCDAAVELASPVLDYEEAARDAGWTLVDRAPDKPQWARGGSDKHPHHPNWFNGLLYAESAEEACAALDIEPHYREVFEHWIVSDWLADKLEAKGEKVDKDFAGLTVWARTTTGQAIYMDAVIQEIARDLNQ